jgi:exosortase/archaeosortase family protein
VSSAAARNTYPALVAATCAFLLVLPFVTTFNDFLTAGVNAAGLSAPIQVIAAGEASLVTGLRGNYTWAARIQVTLIGSLGTICLNLVRVAAVCLLAATWGRLPAVLFHDYGGTLLIVGWLFAFWALADRWILGDPIEDEAVA